MHKTAQKSSSLADRSNHDLVLKIRPLVSNNLEFTLPLAGTGNISIDWGDGATSKHESPNHDRRENQASHIYHDTSVRTIVVSGNLSNVHFGVGDNDGLLRFIPSVLEVVDWGDFHYVSLEAAFKGARNLVAVPNWIPPKITSLARVFEGAVSFNSLIDQ